MKNLDRAVLSVRGLDTDAARVKVLAALRSVPGVASAETHGPDQALVTYDGGETTVMDLIRSLRKLGFLAGMG
ncbi:MAG: heavy-metal-associated domain-containing protein [Trueperaceae bacterium]